jgi:hypothetical protein
VQQLSNLLNLADTAAIWLHMEEGRIAAALSLALDDAPPSAPSTAAPSTAAPQTARP